MPPDLTDAKRAVIIALLKQTIAADPFPLSPRVERLRGILAKLEPSVARPQSYPPPKPPGEPSLLYRKLRGGVRRR
jgi:hypothetical protein